MEQLYYWPEEYLRDLVYALNARGIRPKDAADAIQHLVDTDKVRREVSEANARADALRREMEGNPCLGCGGRLIEDGLGGRCPICDE